MKGAPKTTKQTVTGQKAQEKSLNGTYWLQRRNTVKDKSSSWKSWCIDWPSEKALCAYIIMTIIQGIQQRPLHHDYKQTKTLPVIMIHSFQTSVTDVRCWKWFTETSQIITVSGQTHSCPYHNYIYIYYTLLVYYSSTRKKEKSSLFPV